MENNTKLTVGAIITLALFLSGSYYVSQDNDAYSCSAKNIVMICEKLSSGLGTRCYYEDTYKICKEGWKKIEIGEEIGEEIIKSDGAFKWKCSPEKCVRIN